MQSLAGKSEKYLYKGGKMGKQLLSRSCLIIRVIICGILFSSGCNRPGKIQKVPDLSSYDPVVVKWAQIFSPSSLTLEQRCEQLKWFSDNSKKFSGQNIRSVGEDIETSFWESQVLARAFFELTGILVDHQVIGEGDLVDRIMEQTGIGTNYYDIYVNDADLIGTHLRRGNVVILSDYMANEGKPYTDPMLDLSDFLNLEFGQDYEGRQLQIPDYQFALVYWFRYDWFSDPRIKKEFYNKYGYELGVPQNWAAYEDIAAFFTGRTMVNPNGLEVKAWGHADYGLPGPWLGWRFTDAFFSLAGMGSIGLPNGLPVDEWGVRVENRIPVGASVERGGEINSPAAVYGLTKWLEYLHSYAPPKSLKLDWLGLGPVAASGEIAQSWYWCIIYQTLNPEYNSVGSPVCDKQGRPLWRVAPMPVGQYWEDSMKMGYQDAGSWTIPESTIGDKRHASWLWAQFCLSKTVAVKKFLAGGTLVRKSTLWADYLTANMEQYGGMIEFLRSPMLKKFTCTGRNIPMYPDMQRLWWKNIANCITGESTSKQALDHLGFQLDSLMGKLTLRSYSPVLNQIKTREFWLGKPGGPKSEIFVRPQARTISYDTLLAQWKGAQ